jgi:hypothetical protein
MKQINSNDYVDWIRTQTGLPWLMLDFKCPWKDILPEIKQMTEWIPYRNESGNNWSSLALHGIDGDYKKVYHTDNNVKYDWTSIAGQCPVTKDFLQNNAGIKSHERTRFMKIDPGGSIFLHHDRDDQNGPLTRDIMRLGILHFAIQHPKGCDFTMPHWGDIPIKNGSTWFFSNVWEHTIVNNGDKPRYHIICNGARLNWDFWSPILIRSWKKFKRSYAKATF